MKAVIYARFSSNNQRQESIDAQVRACREYAIQKGIEVIHIYADRAISGTTAERPQFQEMMQAAKSKLFDLVLVHKLDRFGRNQVDTLSYEQKLNSYGVELVSVLEQFGHNPEAIIIKSLFMGMSEYYSANLSREVMKGMKENALKGRWNGGIPPFGYCLNPETMKLEIIEKESEAVKLIFELYVGGASYSKISATLLKNGYVNRSGKAFETGSLHDLLSNEKYIGRMVYGKHIHADAIHRKSNPRSSGTSLCIENAHPAIIDIATWEAAQVRMNARKRGMRCDAKVNWLLAGLCRCGHCGQLLHTCPRSAKGKSTLYYYRCTTKGCQGGVEKYFIESEVISQLDKAITPESQRELALKLVQSIGQQDDKKQITKRLKVCEQKINNLSQALADGAPWIALKSQWETLQAEREQLQCDLLSSSANSFGLQDALDFLQMFGVLNTLNEDAQREIIQRNIREIMITQDDTDRKAWMVDIFLFPPQAPTESIVGAYNGTGSCVPSYTPQITIEDGSIVICFSVYSA